MAAHGQDRPLYNLSVTCGDSSPSRGAFGKEISSQCKGELAGLSATPEPPLLGEVALRSNDGEVVQSRALSRRCVGAAASKTRVPPKARSGCWVPQPGAAERSEAERASLAAHSADGEGTPSKIRAKARKDFSK